ncbi:MAG: flippase-like domain-containing protein [Chitinispirillaceae bacterium]|nr:flippase-like domain-containing protein [Chitinispirillaceae bacterium]
MNVEILKKHTLRLLNPGSRGSQYIQIGITILFIYLVNRSISAVEFGLLLRSLDPFAILTAVVLGGVAILTQAFRWYLISRNCSLNISWGTALKRLLWGNLLAFITPGSVGELFRSVDLCPSKKMVTIISTLADRIFGNIIVVFSALPVLFIQLFFMQRSISEILSAATVITSVLIVLFFVLMKFNIQWYDKLPVKLAGTVSDFVVTLQSLDLSVMMLLSLFHHMILVVQAAFLIQCFVNVSFFEGVMVAVLANTCMLFLPFAIANMGIREYSYSLFLSIAVIQESTTVSIPAIAFGVSSVLLIINNILPATAGLFCRIVSLRVKTGIKADSVNDVLIIQSNKLSKEKRFN